MRTACDDMMEDPSLYGKYNHIICSNTSVLSYGWQEELNQFFFFRVYDVEILLRGKKDSTVAGTGLPDFKKGANV